MSVQVIARFARIPKEYRGQGALLLIEPEGLDVLRQYTASHEKEPYRLTIEYGSARSLSQNDKFHAGLERYANKAGLKKDEAKATMKHEHGVIYPYRDGFIPPARSGVFVEIYGQIEFQVSTAEYTKAEFVRLIEGLEREIAEIGA